MRKGRPAPRRELPDLPAPDLSRFAHMDDASVILLLGQDPDARLELDNRLRKEVQMSGTWQSGPDCPPRRDRY